MPKLASTDPGEILRWKNIRKEIILLHQLLILSWCLSDFWSKSSEGSLKLHSMCPEEIFEGKKSFEIKSFFSISFWIWADDFQDSGKKCRKHHQSCILPVQTNILPKKTFFEKKKSTLAVFQGKNLRISAEKCLQTFSEGTKFAKNGNSNHLLTVGEKVSNFSSKFRSRAVRTAF